MKTLPFITIISAFFLLSCSNNSQTDSEQANAGCSYEYQSAYTTVKWTAYKFTEKLGVGGAFDEFEVTPGKDSGSISGMMTNLNFSIPISSTNTANPDRDYKIKTYFFGNLDQTENITGKITSVQMSDSSNGTAEIELSMNGNVRIIPANVSLIGNEVTLKTDINVGDWQAQYAIDSLNKVCWDLHKGSDGVSKLWPDVSIEVSSTLRKICPDGVASN